MSDDERTKKFRTKTNSFLIAQRFFARRLIARLLRLQTVVRVERWICSFLLHQNQLVVRSGFANKLRENLNLSRLVWLNRAEMLRWVLWEAVAQFDRRGVEKVVEMFLVDTLLTARVLQVLERDSAVAGAADFGRVKLLNAVATHRASPVPMTQQIFAVVALHLIDHQ